MLGGQTRSAMVSTKGTHDDGKVDGGERLAGIGGDRGEGGGGGGVTTVMLHERATCTLLLSFAGILRDVIVRTYM